MLQTPASIEAAVATAIDRFGSVDVLVNNASMNLRQTEWAWPGSATSPSNGRVSVRCWV
jgi:NAD(P)-dependent dehydrogenase (short-subunit alcohol dehydrogenase family)